MHCEMNRALSILQSFCCGCPLPFVAEIEVIRSSLTFRPEEQTAIRTIAIFFQRDPTLGGGVRVHQPTTYRSDVLYLSPNFSPPSNLTSLGFLQLKLLSFDQLQNLLHNPSLIVNTYFHTNNITSSVMTSSITVSHETESSNYFQLLKICQYFVRNEFKLAIYSFLQVTSQF